MHIGKTSKHQEANKDLEPGEWRLYCPKCDWKGERNAASSGECPECGSGMIVIENKGD